MTVVKVKAGACGFVTRILATRENKRNVMIKLESDCESVDDLGYILQEMGPLGMKDILARGLKANPVFHVSSEKLPHSGCPVPIAIIKASEVELKLNLPSAVSIEFEPDIED
ncbi:MAG: hypothetical protein M1511_02085 [Deltaproteobacteria bacterium]|nr:hypothetical protein [Deltaproteobacteria bacterium]